jgi:hypothetical protein
MTAVRAECTDGVYRVVLAGEEDELAGFAPGELLPPRPRPLELVPAFAASQLVDVDASGATIAVLLSRRPPLLISHDRGRTWSERGSGLPSGRALALGPTPDDIVYAGRNRLFVSADGGRFWRALLVELPEIRGVAWE